MAGDVRFLKQRKTRDAAAGKLVPQRFADGMKAHFLDQTKEQSAQGVGVGDGGGVAMMRFDDPLTAGSHLIVPSQRMALRHITAVRFHIQDRISPGAGLACRN